MENNEERLNHYLGNEPFLDSLPREVSRFVRALVNKHGGGRLSQEAKGLHLYLPCPKCLEEKGSRELDSKHLTVNVDKYFSAGRFKNQPAKKAKWSAMCHKDNAHMMSVEQLLQYPSISLRGYDSEVRLTIAVQDESSLVNDGKGNKIPRHPGKVVSLKELPTSHPAVEYLLKRGYDIDSLHRQFRTSYCYEEWPEEEPSGASQGWKYKRLPGGWKDTPQGRIIFYVDVHGVQKGWQARLIDKVEGDWRWYWHPYDNQWEAVEYKQDDTFVMREDYTRGLFKWKPSKYRTATGCHRNQIVMGFDAAMRWNADNNIKTPIVFIVEGPLDAARIGPPACAILGKSLSTEQAQLLRPFKKIVIVMDNDDAGRTGIIRAQNILGPMGLDYDICHIPEKFKDVGEMCYLDVARMTAPYITACMR